MPGKVGMAAANRALCREREVVADGYHVNGIADTEQAIGAVFVLLSVCPADGRGAAGWTRGSGRIAVCDWHGPHGNTIRDDRRALLLALCVTSGDLRALPLALMFPGSLACTRRG
jgi:hypothetical protein